MKLLLIITSIILSCNQPKLFITTKCNEALMNHWIDTCIQQYKPANHREAEYYRNHCLAQASTLFCQPDSTVIHKQDTIPFNNTPTRVKNRITNIQR